MKHLKMLALAAMAVMALMAFVGASTASATTFTVTGVKQTAQITIHATLKTGTSTIIKDKNGTTNDTCTSSTMHYIVQGITTSGSISLWSRLSSWIFGSCSHTTDVIAPGELGIGWISGTTNGTVSSSGAEVTVKSTVFGVSAICKTGAGTTIGTVTGVTSGNATMDINATTLDCGAVGTSSWTGEYIITSPHGFGITS